MGTRCLSISVVRRSGGAAGSVVRRSGGAGGGAAAGSLDRSSVIGRLLEALERAGDATVLADPPEVDREEQGAGQRQQDHVEHVEPEQRVLPHLDAAQEEQLRGLVEQW